MILEHPFLNKENHIGKELSNHIKNLKVWKCCSNGGKKKKTKVRKC
jgi:hypothetical protein